MKPVVPIVLSIALSLVATLLAVMVTRFIARPRRPLDLDDFPGLA